MDTIHSLAKLKSMMWQKSKMKWLKDGDVNTSFFHGWLNKRRRRNEILCLRVENRLVVEVGELEEVIREHFRTHFNSH